MFGHYEMETRYVNDINNLRIRRAGMLTALACAGMLAIPLAANAFQSEGTVRIGSIHSLTGVSSPYVDTVSAPGTALGSEELSRPQAR